MDGQIWIVMTWVATRVNLDSLPPPGGPGLPWYWPTVDRAPEYRFWYDWGFGSQGKFFLSRAYV